MPGGLFLDICVSTIGKSSQSDLDVLRGHLAIGADPAYDYTEALEEKQKSIDKQKEAQKPKHEKEEKKTPVGTGGPIVELRKSLREHLKPKKAEGEEEESTPSLEAAPSPEDTRSRAFKAPTRRELMKFDIHKCRTGPPVGTHNPKDSTQKLRTNGVDLAPKNRTRSRKVLEAQIEVSKLLAGNQSVDHLTKSGTSVEFQDEVPDHKKKLSDISFGNALQHVDMGVACGMMYNDNSYTCGVLDGDMAMRPQPPEWSFDSTSTLCCQNGKSKPIGVRETYFQPGQYKVNLEATRPRLVKKNIHFDYQKSRERLKEVSPYQFGRFELEGRLGDHLPDRSLSRSCPLISKYPAVTGKTSNMTNDSDRPQLKPTHFEFHDELDPVIEERIHNHRMNFDAYDAQRAIQPLSKSVQKFELTSRRMSDLKKQRAYGEEMSIKLSRENLDRGPVSVELLDHEINDTLIHSRLKVKDFSSQYQTARVYENRHKKVPARKKDPPPFDFVRMPKELERGSDARALSTTTDTIRQFRLDRSIVEFNEAAEAAAAPTTKRVSGPLNHE